MTLPIPRLFSDDATKCRSARPCDKTCPHDRSRTSSPYRGSDEKRNECFQIELSMFDARVDLLAPKSNDGVTREIRSWTNIACDWSSPEWRANPTSASTDRSTKLAPLNVPDCLDAILTLAEGKSVLDPNTESETLAWVRGFRDDRVCFKTISNKFLAKHAD
jgi:hypothetical protein